MSTFVTYDDFIAMWPLWLMVLAVGAFVIATRKRKLPPRAPLSQSLMMKQMIANGIDIDSPGDNNKYHQ